MADENEKVDAAAVAEAAAKAAATAESEDFIFDLADQPTINVKLKSGKIISFAADMVTLEMMQAGVGTKETANDSETVLKVCKIVEKYVGEPIGPGMATAILGRTTALLKEYRKKASATPGSDTTSESGEPNTSAPAP